MIKWCLQKVLKTRNPDFSFDKEISNSEVIGLLTESAIGVLRGVILLGLRFRTAKMMHLGRGVRFTSLNKIKYGRFLKLGEYCYLSALSRDGLILGDNVSIGAYSRIEVSQSYNNIGRHIIIGNNVGISAFAGVGGAGGLKIGDDCIIGQYFSCHPENHCFDNPDTIIRKQGVTRKGITIGRNCWIGAKVTILDGVSIGDGCVIAAGAVVNKSFSPGTIIGGVPARVIGKVCQ